MQTLEMSANRFTGAIPPSWANLTALQRVNLDNNSLDGSLDDSLCKLPGLQDLSVGHEQYLR